MTQLDDARTSAASFDLADRYRAGSGPVLLTGVQAIARQLVEQHVRDTPRRTRVATFVSGYQGSPLGGLDKLLARHAAAARPSTTSPSSPASTRSSPRPRSGAARPSCPQGDRDPRRRRRRLVRQGPRRRPRHRRPAPRQHVRRQPQRRRPRARRRRPRRPSPPPSPRASERSLAALGMPVLFPRNAEEIITFGLLRRRAVAGVGLLVALKIVADVADGALDRRPRLRRPSTSTVPEIEWEGTAVVATGSARWRVPHRQRHRRGRPVRAALGDGARRSTPPTTDRRDRGRPAPARGSASPPPAPPTTRVRQALLDLGVDDAALADAGIRVLRVGMPYPLGADAGPRASPTASSRSSSSRTRPPFVETQVKEILYGAPSAPRSPRQARRRRAGR